jgi:hypothetical protein
MKKPIHLEPLIYFPKSDLYYFFPEGTFNLNSGDCNPTFIVSTEQYDKWVELFIMLELPYQ